MKRLMFVVCMVMAMFAGPVAAGCAMDQASIPDIAKKQLELECLKAEEAAKQAANGITDAEKISKYAGLATEVASAVGLAAEKLGVEVNKFILTPAGLLTISVILLKIFGKFLGLMIVSFIINVVSFKILSFLWYEDLYDGDKKRVMVTQPKWFGLRSKQVPDRRRLRYKDVDSDIIGWTIILLIASVGSVILVPLAGL